MTTEAKVQGPASYFPSIEKKYGQPIDHWMGVLKAAGPMKHMELVARLKRLDLSPWVAGSAVHVNVASQKSRLYHTGLVADAVREALQLTTPRSTASPAACAS